MFDFKKIRNVITLAASRHAKKLKHQDLNEVKIRPKIQNDLVTIPEAAMILGCSPPAIRKYIRQGLLASIRIGEGKKRKNVFIRKDILTIFKDSYTIKPRIKDEPSPHLELLRSLLKQDPYYTYQELGEFCGVTRERVRQILYANNISKVHGKRDRFKPNTYISVHIKDNVITDINIGADSHISKTEVLEFLDPEHEKFLGIPLDRIQMSTIHITSQLRPRKKTNGSIRKYCENGHHVICLNNPRNESSWKCYICKPLYLWEYIDAEGKIEKESKTKPCNTCGKPVAKRAAILWRQERDERYHGNFYCSRKCFYDHQNENRWWTASPIYQGTYGKKEQTIPRICVICNTPFKAKSTRTILCSKKCRQIRMDQAQQKRRDKKNSSSNTANFVHELMERGMEAKYIASYLNCDIQTVYAWKRGLRPSRKNVVQLRRLAQSTKRLGV